MNGSSMSTTCIVFFKPKFASWQSWPFWHIYLRKNSDDEDGVQHSRRCATDLVALMKCSSDYTPAYWFVWEITVLTYSLRCTRRNLLSIRIRSHDVVLRRNNTNPFADRPFARLALPSPQRMLVATWFKLSNNFSPSISPLSNAIKI